MDGARLQRKIGIITGAASGIGRATARRLAAEGAQLVLADIRPVDLALSDIRACGTEAAHCQADVSKSSDVEAMVSFAVGRFGVLDFLVNNAGIPLIKTVLDTSEEEWDRVMAVNLKSIFLACRAAIPVLRGRDGATIVNVASELGRLQSLAGGNEVVIGPGTQCLVAGLFEHFVGLASASIRAAVWTAMPLTSPPTSSTCSRACVFRTSSDLQQLKETVPELSQTA